VNVYEPREKRDTAATVLRDDRRYPKGPRGSTILSAGFPADVQVLHVRGKGLPCRSQAGRAFLDRRSTKMTSRPASNAMATQITIRADCATSR